MKTENSDLAAWQGILDSQKSEVPEKPANPKVRFRTFDGTTFEVKADLDGFGKSLTKAWQEEVVLRVENEKGERRLVNPYAVAWVWEEE